MKLLTLAICFTMVCSGCRVVSHVPVAVSPTAEANLIFNDVTHIELSVWAGGTRKEVRYVISSQDEISQVEQAFARAQWRPFIDTIPADSVRFRAMNGNVELFKFTYGAGWIYNWTANPRRALGKGIPIDSDRKILREIIDRAARRETSQLPS